MISLLDNTVLSNFALVSRIELLSAIFYDSVATTSQVVAEFQNGIERGRLPQTDLSWLKIIDLNQDELYIFDELLAYINAGEAACLAVAIVRNGLVLTDDRDARKISRVRKIPISGTLGVLGRCVKLNLLDLEEANQLLHEMIQKGYRSSVDRLVAR